MTGHENLPKGEATNSAIPIEPDTPLQPVKERDNMNLLELVCQLHCRALQYPSKEMHDAYIEARTELESRLSEPSSKEQEWDAVGLLEWIANNQFSMYDNMWTSTKIHYSGCQYTTEQLYQLYKKKP